MVRDSARRAPTPRRA